MKRFLKTWPFLLILLGLMSCQPTEDEQEPEEPTDTVVEDEDSASLEDVGACYTDIYSPQPDDHVAELDILVVSYNSINLKPHRKRLANNIQHLFAQIPEGVNYRVGVMQGLGSHSSKSGKLYQRRSEPLVLKSDAMDVSEMKSHLKEKLNPPTVEVVLESIFGGGSMGIYSLYKGMTDHYDEIKNQGLFREDASLLVLYVSDQSDVCARYPEGVDTFNRRLRSTHIAPRHKAFERDCFIEGDTGETVQLDHDVLYEKLIAKTDGALNISGVLYNNQATVPHAAWKEYGYGYTDLIERAGGISHDLASSNYDEALTKIGMVSSASVIQNDKFNLQVSDVLVSTIDVAVDGDAVGFDYIPELNQVHLQEPRSSLSEVEVKYCERKEVAPQNLMVSAGGQHTCALHGDGSVRCWGGNNFGQLGQGHTDMLGDDEPVSSIPPLVFDEKITSLATGAFHTCALSETGKVYCWGRNIFGQLGTGDTQNRGDTLKATELDPVELAGPAMKIYAGTFLNCAILESGDVHCWGDNRLGQLGYGHTNNVGDDELPSSQPPLSFDKELAQLDLSTISNHICALFEDGSQKCWGYNNKGQLGLGDTVSRGDDETLDQVPYVSVDNDFKPISVATGNEHTCVLLDNQTVKCWGRNEKDMFDQPQELVAADGDVPSDYGAIDFGAAVLSMTTGNFFTCAVSTSHQAKCWGDNSFGQAGYPSDNSEVGENELVSELPFIDLGDYQVDRISGGTFHACALVKGSKEIMCWGDNRFGQLGYGDTISTSDAGAPTTLERGVIDFEGSSELP